MPPQPNGWIRVDNAVLPLLAAIKGGQAIGVYVALKSYADADGVCWPKLESIAARSGVCRRKVCSILDAIAAIDPPILERTLRNSADGRSSNLYRFLPTPSAPHAPGQVAQVHHMHGPSAPHALPKCTTCTGTRSIELDPLNKNQYLFPNLLSEVIAEWNALGPSVGPPIRNPQRPPKALLEVYKRLERDDELREAFADLPAVIAAIRKAKYCHRQPWFTLPWIFTRDKETKELRVHRILNGVYANGSKGNGFQRGAAVFGAGQKFDPATAGQKATI